MDRINPKRFSLNGNIFVTVNPTSDTVDCSNFKNCLWSIDVVIMSFLHYGEAAYWDLRYYFKKLLCNLIFKKFLLRYGEELKKMVGGLELFDWYLPYDQGQVFNITFIYY